MLRCLNAVLCRVAQYFSVFRIHWQRFVCFCRDSSSLFGSSDDDDDLSPSGSFGWTGMSIYTRWFHALSLQRVASSRFMLSLLGTSLHEKVMSTKGISPTIWYASLHPMPPCCGVADYRASACIVSVCVCGSFLCLSQLTK